MTMLIFFAPAICRTEKIDNVIYLRWKISSYILSTLKDEIEIKLVIDFIFFYYSLERERERERDKERKLNKIIN